jgi:hypothetical protein
MTVRESTPMDKQPLKEPSSLNSLTSVLNLTLTYLLLFRRKVSQAANAVFIGMAPGAVGGMSNNCFFPDEKIDNQCLLRLAVHFIH